jgi:dihydrolipoamide dehydrogenase
MYQRFGSKVTIIEVLPRIVPLEDEEISRELAASFKRQGIAVYPDTRVERVSRGEGGVEVSRAPPATRPRRSAREGS